MRQVLTMEYVPGIKINRIAALDELGVDRKRYLDLALNNRLEQIENFCVILSLLNRITLRLSEINMFNKL